VTPANATFNRDASFSSNLPRSILLAAAILAPAAVVSESYFVPLEDWNATHAVREVRLRSVARVAATLTWTMERNRAAPARDQGMERLPAGTASSLVPASIAHSRRVAVGTRQDFFQSGGKVLRGRRD